MRQMTPRQQAILEFLEEERGVPHTPGAVAATVSRRGIPTHPSAAAKALRKLVCRRRVAVTRTEGTAVLLKDQRLVKQGGQNVSVTPTYLYRVL